MSLDENSCCQPRRKLLLSGGRMNEPLVITRLRHRQLAAEVELQTESMMNNGEMVMYS